MDYGNAKISVSQESADVAVDKLKEKYPNAIVDGISPNLASMEYVRKAFKEATEKYGCVDILVNNAGIFRKHLIYGLYRGDFG